MAKCQVRWALLPWVCVVAIVGGDAVPRAIAQVSESLRPPSAFTDIADRAARSRALFAEAAKVITSPRCMNCHPAGDSPSQGDDEHVHRPAAFRGEAGVGVPGLPCAACHTDKKLPAFSWGGKLSEYSWPPPLGLGANRDGVAGQITGSNLSADKGSHAQWRTEPRSTAGAHGNR
jgi:hypothetical protein